MGIQVSIVFKQNEGMLKADMREMCLIGSEVNVIFYWIKGFSIEFGFSLIAHS